MRLSGTVKPLQGEISEIELQLKEGAIYVLDVLSLNVFRQKWHDFMSAIKISQGTFTPHGQERYAASWTRVKQSKCKECYGVLQVSKKLILSSDREGISPRHFKRS